ncbi:MAG: peptide/nickel transport system substrate-binding protein [Blastocatellia bacterium]|nr:peptide/nickel transport system substrate-binding protein [Blastocatellia bacterium]
MRHSNTVIQENPVRSNADLRAHRRSRMRFLKCFSLSALLLTAILLPSACKRSQSNVFVIALSDNIKTIDPIGSPSVDAASERVRTLMFNSLVKKDDKFDYVPELASNIQRSDDGLSFTFTLRDGVTFHDGRPFTSADAKYTLDTVLASTFAKATSFFQGSGASKIALVKSVEAPDPRTLIIRLNKQWTGLLPNLVPIAMIPKDSYESQKAHPLGTGPFKFKSYDQVQQVLDLEANQNYWDGPSKLPALRVRAISESNTMQAELQSGRVDIAPLATSLSPDAIQGLSKNPNLSVQQFGGSNLNLLTFNTTEAPLDNIKVRQALAYAIDRESMIRDLVLNQGEIAHSILPEASWAYQRPQTYQFDPNKAKQLLDEAGFRDPDGDGPQMRWATPLLFRISGSSAAARQYSGVVQNYLKNVGVPVAIETSEFNTMRQQVQNGQFQINYSQWVGGNQDPIFYHDLFATSEIATPTKGLNRSRYSNPELDKILDEAANTYDHAKAAPLYAKAQEIIARDVPVFPLWYQANMVIAKKSVGNIKVNASGDWGFIKDLTVTK